ncbi:hypothetical protein ACJJTC_012668 [Scirpophaga incertulas]
MGEHALTMSDDNLEQHIVTLFEKLECLRSSHCDSALPGRMPARLEVRTLSLWKAVVAECAASFLYVFIVCGAAGGAGVGASASAVLLATALASGCAIATLTLCFAKISGAHVSPGVSVAQCVRRRVSPLRAALYVAAQCGGAIAGAAAVYGVSVPGHAGSLSAALPGGGAGGAAWERLGAELVLSALVTAAYCAAMERRYTGAAPALLGAAYCAAGFVSMPSINPARSLGPSFVLSRWESHWVSWVGGLGGGIACALILEWGSRRPPTDLSRASSPRDLDQLDRVDKPFPYRSYCSAAAPRPDPEPLYSGTKSLYCRSPPPARHTLHRSQSVYSSSTAAGASLVAAQSLLLRPHAAPLAAHNAHNAHSAHTAHSVHNQNAHNAQREPAYGTANGIRPGPAGAAVPERRESVYSAGGSVSVGTGTTGGPGAGAGGGAGAGALGTARRGPLASDDSAYGSTYRAYRPPPRHDHY